MKKRLDNLRKLVQAEKVFEVEDILADIMDDGLEDEIGSLFELISDKIDSDDIIFSIIHSVETLEDEKYILTFFSHLPLLYSQAKSWTEVLMRRIRNNSKTLKVFEDILSSQSSENIEIVRKINDLIISEG